MCFDSKKMDTPDLKGRYFSKSFPFSYISDYSTQDNFSDAMVSPMKDERVSDYDFQNIAVESINKSHRHLKFHQEQSLTE